jgi:cytochrome c oxidase subunit 4
VKLATAYAALLVLLATTYGVSFFELGAWNFWINLSIAAAKAALVVVVFMRAGSTPLARSVLIAALGFLAILYWLTADDYLTRPPAGEPDSTLVLDGRPRAQ